MDKKTQTQEKHFTETDWHKIVYLCACAVNGIKPDISALGSINTEDLFEMARKHQISSAVGMALESAGIKEECFTQAIAQAMRKNALLDADRANVLAALEEAGIWYMPLKGAILKDMYPRYGMRQMADNDILFDPDRRADVREIMEKLGFSVKDYEITNHDVYRKKPVSNFEMHVYLINGRSNDQLMTYYLNVKDRLLKDEGNRYGYHFTDEDFYLFLVAHDYKHNIQGGIGLRSLLDSYVYLTQKQDDLDWDYIQQETKKMGIDGFEALNRSLSMHLFNEEPLSEQEKEMYEYILSSGAYGTMFNDTANQFRNKGRFGFFLSRLTLPYDDMLIEYPILKKAPLLYPVIWVWRFIHMFFVSRKKFMYQLKLVLGLVKEKDLYSFPMDNNKKKGND